MESVVRFGVVLPAANTTVETEFPAALQARATAHFQRFTSLASSPDQARTSAEGALEAARMLKPARLSAIAVAYTTGSYFGAPDYDDWLPRQITEACGIPATTAGLAIVEALRELKATRVAVVSPYPQLVNDHCRAYLTQKGLDMVALVGSAPRGPAGEVPLVEVEQMVRQVAKEGAEAVLISCTGLRTLPLLGVLETEIGVPVVSSNQAMLRSLLRLGGLETNLQGLGILLAGPPSAAR